MTEIFKQFQATVIAQLQSNSCEVVISIKNGWNTIAWVKIIHLGHYPYQQQNLKILSILQGHNNQQRKISGTRYIIIINMKLISSWSLKKWLSFKKRYRPRPILESKDMCVIFHKEGKKRQNIWKFGQNCTKFENILKKGSLMHATITRLKQLQYALRTFEWQLHMLHHIFQPVLFSHNQFCLASWRYNWKEP